MVSKHARLIRHSFAASLQGALLDSYNEEQLGGHLHITMKIRELECTALPELLERDGVLREQIKGNYIPAQLHFSGVSEIKTGNFFKGITNLAPDDPARTINDMLSWRQPGKRDVLYLFFMQGPQIDNLMFFARRVIYERFSQDSTPVTLDRDWCPPPPMPDRLIPSPRRLHQRFGGDPITFYLDSRPYRQSLFIGGLEIQEKERPQVDVVLNLGERPSNWVKDGRIPPQDRWDPKGEGTEGMSIEVIREEANWVIERLKNKKRMLVHCAAGMNRSSTVCCAALILLEGLTAEQALERVREHHPWARPDSGHWLKLRWLAKRHRESL